MIEIDNIYNMDCIEGMKLMANGSVDAVIADLPYGVLNRSNKAATLGQADTARSVVETVPQDHQAGKPRYPLCAGHFLGATHALATPDVAV